METALSRDANVVRYAFGRALEERYPNRTVVQVDDAGFDVRAFSKTGRCAMRLRQGIHHDQGEVWAKRGKLATKMHSAWMTAEWSDSTIDVVALRWRQGWDHESVHWVIGDDAEVARAFVTAVLDFAHIPEKTVRVYTSACWGRDDALWEAIQRADWDDLILPQDVVEHLRADIGGFLGARELYARYGVPHKRGVLLNGPPGNGKTHCARVLMKEASLPMLYVRSFEARYGEVDANILSVFSEARRVAPCLLVLEDLDTLVKGPNLSVFLNELDGLDPDTGILTLATTNHPERLDAALVERPSRFDRKYHFDLPRQPERLRYLEMWNERFDAAMRLPAASVAELASATEAFSFAYLKELVMSSMARWMLDPGQRPMQQVMAGELAHLRDHARAPRPAPEVSEVKED